MFTTSVANIGPFEEIVVAIEYQETLRYDEGSFRVRFPLAITPRYIPGTPVAQNSSGIGWSPATQQVHGCRSHHAAGRRPRGGLRESRGDHHRSPRRLRALPGCPAPTTRCASRSNPDTGSG